MLRNTRAACLSVALLLGAAGCNSFLTGDKLSSNPNFPTASTVQTLFVGVQSGMYALHEGTVAMQICEWVQHCGGTNGRYVQNLGLYNYGNASNIGANVADWFLVYDQGGLIDLKAIERAARAAGDSVYLGIAKIWEAFNIGMATDMWGSIPYTQAASPTVVVPDTDSQWVVYDSVQALLSEASAELTNGTATLPTPPDLLFGGNPAKWIAVANTLKARYWMHVANAAAAGKHPRGFTGPQVYGFAIAAASAGIADPSGAGDFKSVHAGPTFSQNMWEQFQSSSGFGGDLEAGFALVDYMKRRGDPRLAQYFCTNGVSTTWKAATADVVGTVILDAKGNMEVVTVAGTSGAAAPSWATTMDATTTDGTVTWVNNGPPYEGDIWNNTVTAVDSAVIGAGVSTFACLPPGRFGLTAPVPFVTYQENELILAEAYDKTGNAPLAQTHLGNAYAAVPGLASKASGGLVDPALLDSIMREKWVVMFQNVEALMDYERTCLPASVKPASPNFLNITYIPGQLFYPNAERNLQPHIPLESTQLAGKLRTPAEVPTPCHP
jgi:SusD/RagB-like outer membrane lipoprotein